MVTIGLDHFDGPYHLKAISNHTSNDSPAASASLDHFDGLFRVKVISVHTNAVLWVAAK